ncbi:MAG: serine/threonine-protein kinase [Pyrinomonadaceae bacterium]
MRLLAPNALLQNRYLTVHLIGKGGMGEVYLAIDQRLGSAVALKRTSFSDEETLGNAFEREARTLARLRHPVLPKVSDHFIENDTQYLVMEHIAGEDLAERLKSNNKPFPLSWVLFWADQLLDALTYLHLHEPPILHRDIKPQNLKLTTENHIVLLDFGLSKNNTAETKITTYGSIVGYTPHYAPMEQIRGTGTDARSDIYSLSATLFQILTNTVPPDSLTRADVLLNDLPDPLKLICEINPEVPRAVSEVILRGMSVSQEKRFVSAREMQKALRDAHARGIDSENLLDRQIDQISLGILNGTSDFNTNLQTGGESNDESVAAIESYPPRENKYSQTFVPPAAPEVKRSSNIFTIIGGLSALFIFAIGAAGFVWFLTGSVNNQTENVIPLPPASAANKVVPTPAPASETITDPNAAVESGSVLSNTDSQNDEQLSGNNTVNSSDKRKSAPTTKQTSGRVSAPKPTSQTPAAKKTPRPTPQPTPKKTPKSQRTEILQ